VRARAKNTGPSIPGADKSGNKKPKRKKSKGEAKPQIPRKSSRCLIAEHRNKFRLTRRYRLRQESTTGFELCTNPKDPTRESFHRADEST